MLNEAWFNADEKTKEAAEAIFRFLKKEHLSVEQFHAVIAILPEMVYEDTILQENKATYNPPLRKFEFEEKQNA